MVCDWLCHFRLVIRFPVGREWKPTLHPPVSPTFSLAMRFPVGREWKLCAKFYTREMRPSCDALSRWKGMETDTGRCPHGGGIGVLECPFPFEGNGNNIVLSISLGVSFLKTCDALSHLKGMETCSYERHLHLIVRPCDVLSRLKGMETNTSLLVWNFNKSCDVLSRLKGMETQSLRAAHPLSPFCLLWIRVPV